MMPAWIWMIVTGLSFGLDRWLKILALRGTELKLGWMQFGLVRNYDLVFGIPLPQAWMQIFLVGAIIWILIWALKAWRRDVILFGGASLMFAGAVSNVFDRWQYGFVIDWAFLGQWWPIFNLADVMITIGVVIVLWRYQLTTPR